MVYSCAGSSDLFSIFGCKTSKFILEVGKLTLVCFLLPVIRFAKLNTPSLSNPPPPPSNVLEINKPPKARGLNRGFTVIWYFWIYMIKTAITHKITSNSPCSLLPLYHTLVSFPPRLQRKEQEIE